MKLYKEFNIIFSYLPFAALIKGKILCMHGGISPKLHTIDDIRRISLPVEDPPLNSIEQDLLWADPAFGLNGFDHNRLREVRFLSCVSKYDYRFLLSLAKTKCENYARKMGLIL